MLIRDFLRRLLQLLIGALITDFVTGRAHAGGQRVPLLSVELGFGTAPSGAVTTRQDRIPLVPAKSRGEPVASLS